MADRRIAVVGGGISGLSTAYHLLRLAPPGGRPQVRLFESDDRFGGVVRTERSDGFVLDLGPDSIFTEKADALEIVDGLGLTDELVGAHSEKSVQIWWSGRLHSLPEGFALVAPTRWLPFARSRLFTWPGKLRAAMEVAVPRRRRGGDESIASFVRRRFGDEVEERVAGPLLAGIHAGDPERLSIHETFPRLPALERRHGSVLLGLLRRRRRARGARRQVGSAGAASGSRGVSSGSSGAASGRPPPRFVTFPDGMERLAQSLVREIEGDAPSVLQPATGVESIHEIAEEDDGNRDGRRVRYRVETVDGGAWEADACAVTVPAPRAAPLLRGLDRPLAEMLESIPHASIATVFLGYGEEAAGAVPRSTGFLVPRGQGPSIFAASWVSEKFDRRAPTGSRLVRVFFGGRDAEADLQRTDAELVERARRDLRTVAGLRAEPVLSRVQRWPDGNPQFEIGHGRLVDGIDLRLREHPGLLVLGASVRGVGIPDTLAEGRRAAERLLADR